MERSPTWLQPHQYPDSSAASPLAPHTKEVLNRFQPPNSHSRTTPAMAVVIPGGSYTVLGTKKPESSHMDWSLGNSCGRRNANRHLRDTSGECEGLMFLTKLYFLSLLIEFLCPCCSLLLRPPHPVIGGLPRNQHNSGKLQKPGEKLENREYNDIRDWNPVSRGEASSASWIISFASTCKEEFTFSAFITWNQHFSLSWANLERVPCSFFGLFLILSRDISRFF